MNYPYIEKKPYSGGNQVASIEQDSEGIDFYGRTGYSLTSGEYRWATSGNLTGDSSRGMIFTYNYQGQPTRINFTNTSQQQLNTFSASGQLLYSNTIVMKQARPISSTTRHYSADRIFENGKLLYSYFPGGYFDAEWVPHFTHTDYQGSIIAVTDSAGHVVQHTAYYPYGEPHREPSGQPYLHGGKERLAPSADYDYGPRRYHSSALLWHKPDSKAGDYTHISPYVFCAANPILFTDPTGNNTLDIIQGFIAAIIDNFLLGATDLREDSKKYVSDASDYNAGLDIGDATSALVGVKEMNMGGGAATGGLAVATVSTAMIPVTGGTSAVPAAGGAGVAVLGGITAIHGFAMTGTATMNMAKRKGHISDDLGFELTDKEIKVTPKASPGQPVESYKLRLPKGFRKVKQKSMNADVYYDGRIYISPDKYGHGTKGRGAWKAAAEIEYLNDNELRYGTYDENGRWFRP